MNLEGIHRREQVRQPKGDRRALVRLRERFSDDDVRPSATKGKDGDDAVGVSDAKLARETVFGVDHISAIGDLQATTKLAWKTFRLQRGCVFPSLWLVQETAEAFKVANAPAKEAKLNDRKIEKLCEYASKNPLKIPKINENLEQRCYKDLRNEMFGSVKVVLCIYRRFLSSCISERRKLNQTCSSQVFAQSKSLKVCIREVIRVKHLEHVRY
ncbi:hypothetical protein AHAS_Ahas03G0132700 [Arachis hypogaea]